MVGLVGVLEVCACDATSEWSVLDETLEGTPCGTPQVHKVVFLILLLLVDFFVAKEHSSHYSIGWITSEIRHS